MTISRRSGEESPRPVRVLSVKGKRPVSVRFLGPLMGVLTHFTRSGSTPCLGQERCLPATHRYPIQWKGYAPVEEWEMLEELWCPMVLEITENLEHLLGTQSRRGEIWLLKRKDNHDKGEVVGLYSETLDDAEIPPPFSVLPVLQKLWHRLEFPHGIANPVPRPVLLAPSRGVAPKLLTELAEPVHQSEQATQEAKEAFRKQIRELGLGGARRSSGANLDNGNGTHKSNGKESGT